MLETLRAWHGTVNGWVWGPVTIALLMGTGVYLTLLTRGIQFRWLVKALGEVLGQVFTKTHAEGTVTPFQAVATALASTVGGVMQAMRFGMARGLFSNEAGLGSAPMVHATARTDHPVRQGLYGIFEVFVDTILVCAATGLVVLVTGEWSKGATGAALAAKAFETGLPGAWGDVVVTTGILTFAFSTLLGWSFYGETATAYLFGTKSILPYRLLWLVAAYLGATGSLHVVWDVADTLNGLMALPNLVALLILSPVVARSLREFAEREATAAGRSR